MERPLAIGDGEIRHRLRDRGVKGTMTTSLAVADAVMVSNLIPSSRIRFELSVATRFWRREAREYVSRT